MADITMLLQQMKLAASLATQGEWSYARSGFNSIVQAPVALLRGGPASVVLCKLFRSEWRGELNTAHDAAFIALANPTNVMTLVEALENAQRQIQAHERAEFTWLNALDLPDDASRIDILPAIHAGKYALRDATKRIAELESRTIPAQQSDYFALLVAMARVSADKAMRKFPQPNYVLLKVAEEAGEVVQAGVHYAEKRMEWEQVEGEIVQLLAMLIRLVTEGDQINGITPPVASIQVIEGEE